jgi:hypothetical protein
MRILVFKYCANIKFGDAKETNGGNTEIEVCLDSLKKNHEVTVLTISRYLKNLPEGLTGITWDFIDVDRINEDYDLIFAFNGSLNCYGGKVSNETLTSYRIFNASKIPTIYAITDTNIPIGDLAGWIRNAQSKGFYSELNPDEYEIEAGKISALSQTYDNRAITENWKKKECKFGKFVYFPFEKTVFFREQLEKEICLSPNDHLIYFGNSRGGKRDKKFNQFYCHLNTPTVVYGNWDPEKLMKGKLHISAMPNFMGKKDMYLLHKDINQSLAHCYISDPVNEGTIWTTRFYEAILNRTVLFMDVANDPEKKKFPSKFYYVESSTELDQKLELLRKNPDFRARIIEEQYQSTLANDRAFVDKFDMMLDFSIRKCL